jgi:hypothetical protein
VDWAGAGRAKEQRGLLEAEEQGEEGGGGAGARAGAETAAWEPLRKVGWNACDVLSGAWTAFVIDD